MGTHTHVNTLQSQKLRGESFYSTHMFLTSFPSLYQTPSHSSLLRLQTSSVSVPMMAVTSDSPPVKYTPGSKGNTTLLLTGNRNIWTAWQHLEFNYDVLMHLTNDCIRDKWACSHSLSFLSNTPFFVFFSISNLSRSLSLLCFYLLLGF